MTGALPNDSAPALARALAAALLAGTALVGAGAALHPTLTGDAAADLRLISATGAWRGIHLAMLAGSALVIGGVWTRLVVHRRVERGALVAALALLTLGLALNALNIAYMAGAGLRMAALHASGDALAARVFDLTHPIGQTTARFGNLVVALGAGALGWVERHDATRPRAAAWLAWAAAAGGAAGAVAAHEASPLALAAVALLSGWQLLTAALVFAPRLGGGRGA